jgi:hypothetical protein
MKRLIHFLSLLFAGTCNPLWATDQLTSIRDTESSYQTAEKPYHILRRGDLEAIIVDNRAVDDEVLPGHATGYHGLAALRHTQQKRNLYVPAYGGLNFEHIHDGRKQERDILFEPRQHPMQLRIINKHTVDLYQAPTPFWGMESCTRYELLPDNVIEMTFECIPRRDTFKTGYCGLFWASYIHLPESLDIHFIGMDSKTSESRDPTWQRGVTPSHGTLATHRSMEDPRVFPHYDDFPLSLVYGFSHQRYAQPWYAGICRGMALLQTFRPKDRIWITQSPSGGGEGCPAWDFQWFIPQPKIGNHYHFKMRVAYFPIDDTQVLSKVRETILERVNTRSPGWD